MPSIPCVALSLAPHQLESVDGKAGAQPPGKVIARPERVVAARVFDAACEASRLSNGVLARWLGVDERRVREMRSGHKPVRLDTLLRIPPSVETGVGVALIEHAKSRAIGGR